LHTARGTARSDGSEELYDLPADPHEWTNLASNSRCAARKRELAAWLPQTNAPPAPGSRQRLIELRHGEPFWEGKAIGAEEPIRD